jgi:hypothetical protein
MTNCERLNEFTILTPCPMDWGRMSGDDQARYCPACGKHVHDFARMTAGQATSLLDKLDGDLCGRLTRRADGKVVTADCNPAADLDPVKTPWQFNIRSLMGIVAGFAATLGVGRLLADYIKEAPSRLPAPRVTRTVGRLVRQPPILTPGQSPSPGQPACPAAK